ncbi:MAG: hypothetical protein WA864_31970 [Acetobacteraceae bacterium]
MTRDLAAAREALVLARIAVARANDAAVAARAAAKELADVVSPLPQHITLAASLSARVPERQDVLRRMTGAHSLAAATVQSVSRRIADLQAALDQIDQLAATETPAELAA